MSKLQLKLVNNEQILSSKKLGKACMFEDTGDCVAPATDYCKYCDYGECTGTHMTIARRMIFPLALFPEMFALRILRT